MNKQKKVLLGLTGERRGFGGYTGFIFPDRVILENPKISNAAYVFALRNPIEVPPGRFKLPPAKRLRKEERDKFKNGEWKDIAGLTREEARERGALRIYHPKANISDKDWEKEWEKRMQAAIDGKMESAK